jgi:hypothetical protein
MGFPRAAASRPFLVVATLTAAVGSIGDAAAGDIPASRSTKVTLTIGTTPTAGTWEYVGDSDWYKVKLTAGQNYAFRLNEVGDASSLTLTLRGPNGASIKVSEGDDDSDAGLAFVPKVSGTYYLDARLGGFSDGASGAYQITAGPDCAQGPRTTCKLQLGIRQDRQILFSADADWYGIAMTTGRSYDIAVHDVDGIFIGLELELLDSTGRVVATGEQSTAFDRDLRGFVAPASGTYYAQVRNVFQDVWGPYTITLSASGR